MVIPELHQQKPLSIAKKSKSRDKNRPPGSSSSCQTATSGSDQTLFSGQIAISGSGQTSDSGQNAKKNKFRDKNRPSGSSGSGQDLVSGQTAISSYGQVSDFCHASGSAQTSGFAQTAKKNKKFDQMKKKKKRKWAGLPSHGPTTCEICKKTFSRRADMKNHVSVVHEGKKPYECPRCEMKFGLNGTAHLHFRKMHSEELETVVSLQVKINDFFSNLQKKL